MKKIKKVFFAMLSIFLTLSLVACKNGEGEEITTKQWLALEHYGLSNLFWILFGVVAAIIVLGFLYKVLSSKFSIRIK